MHILILLFISLDIMGRIYNWDLGIASNKVYEATNIAETTFMHTRFQTWFESMFTTLV